MRQEPVEAEHCSDEGAKAFFIVISTLVGLLILSSFIHGESSPAIETNVRIRNETGVPLQQVSVNGVVYGDVATDGITGYQRMKAAYRYADLQLIMAGRKIHLQPEDYVGERPLGKGRFTYRIIKRNWNAEVSVDIQAIRDVDNAAGTAGAGQKWLPTPN